MRMTRHKAPGSRAPPGYDPYAEEEPGFGWVLFAGVLLMMLGVANFTAGIAAIGNLHLFAHNPHYVADSLNTWRWAVLCVGVADWCVGVGAFFVMSQFSR